MLETTCFQTFVLFSQISHTEASSWQLRVFFSHGVFAGMNWGFEKYIFNNWELATP